MSNQESNITAPPGFRPKDSISKMSRRSMSPEIFAEGYSTDDSGDDIRFTRKRNKPQMLDPSPALCVVTAQPIQKRKGRPPGSGRKQKLLVEPVQKRKGRPPGSGRKQKLLAQGAVEKGKEPQVSMESLCGDNNPSTPLQLCKAVGNVKTTPIVRNQNRKGNLQDVNLNDQPGGGEDEKIQQNGSTTDSASTPVNKSLAPILRAIINKHGNILKNCALQSVITRTTFVELICKVVQELQAMELTELGPSQLSGYKAAIKDAEMMNMDVSWLRQRLDEIEKAKESNEEAKKLTNSKLRSMERVEAMKKELQNLNYALEAKKCELQREIREVEKLSSNIRRASSICRNFEGKPLLDGLL